MSINRLVLVCVGQGRESRENFSYLIIILYVFLIHVMFMFMYGTTCPINMIIIPPDMLYVR